jgi:glycosyltransferase involved in cell wall biosynthesis
VNNAHSLEGLRLCIETSPISQICTNNIRTGVPRVAEQFTCGMIRSGMDVTILQCGYSNHLSAVARHLEERTGVPRSRFHRATFFDRLTEEDRAWWKYLRLLPGALRNRIIERIMKRSLRDKMRGRFTILHSTYADFPRPNLLPANIIKTATIYDVLPLTHPQFFDRGARKRFQRIFDSLQHAHHLFSISEHTKNEFSRLSNYPVEKITVVPPAVDHAVFRAERSPEAFARLREKYHLPAAPYLLSLCTLEPRKNLSFIIQAFGEYLRENPDSPHHLVLAGGKGWLAEDFFEKCTVPDPLRHRFLFTGYVAEEDLAALYSHAELFVYLPLAEGFGLPPLEAMSCGTPVLVSNNTSLPEVVGHSGYHASPEDLPALVRQLGTILAPAFPLRQHVEHAAKRAAVFTWDAFVQRHLDVFSECREASRSDNPGRL